MPFKYDCLTTHIAHLITPCSCRSPARNANKQSVAIGFSYE